MTSVTVKSAAGADAGSVELADDVFGIQPNVPVLHQVVTAQLAKRRAGTQSTKTRAEVRGGGKKPYRQKGTGNARQGSTRAPHFSGGGVALGPKPRRHAEGRVLVVESWGFDGPKTRDAKAALAALGIAGTRALVVVDRDDEAAILSFRNLPEIQLIESSELNAYDVLCNEWIVFTQATLPGAAPAAEAEAETEPETETEAEQ